MRYFWSGAAAGCAFVVVALLGRAVNATPTLPELVQDRLVLLMPGPVFSLLLDRFLYLGKPLLFAALLLCQVAIGGLAGMAIGRWRRPFVTAAVLWLVTGVIVLPLAGRSIFAGSPAVAVVTLLAFGAYAVAFMLFARLPAVPWKRSDEPPETATTEQPRLPGSRFDRRRLLAGGLLGLATVILARRAVGKLPALPPRGRALASGGVAKLPGSGAAGSTDAATTGLPPAVTPTDRFYVVSKNLFDPELDAANWSLKVDGLVERPFELRYNDLIAMPSMEAYRTLECISNEIGGDLISNGLWTGVRFADLLQRAGPRPGAAFILFTSIDGYTSDMPLQMAMDPDTLLAYKLNGNALPSKHGYPARILATDIYGMKNPKWLTHVQVVNSQRTGFWQQQGWDEQGIIQTMSRIDTPVGGSRVPGDEVSIGGVAFAGARDIARVEVSTDGGATWTDAKLLPSLGPSTWTLWQYLWQAVQPGVYTIVVRATDGAGTVQTVRRSDPFPSGATGYDQARIRVGS
jgi:DMSO/TMAO reductase YedYZ molybdopterin-dependent catalytic subunit